jgi:hypothetical protein
MVDVSLMLRCIAMDDGQFDVYVRTFGIQGTPLRELSELREHWRGTYLQITHLPTATPKLP